MKKIASFIFCLLCAVGMYADQIPYVVLYNSSGPEAYKNGLRFTWADPGTYSAGTDGVRAVWTGEAVTKTGSGNPGWYEYRSSIQKAVFDPVFFNVHPTSTANWFAECTNLTTITIMENALVTEEVTDMSNMFYYCTGLTAIDVSGFDTQNVTDMSGMFWLCNSITALDLSNFNTEKVTDMSNMFCRCVWLNALDVSSFNTQNVTNMSHMFDGCSYHSKSNMRTITFGDHFDTSKVTDMSYMFYDCSQLTSLDVSGFDTQQVTDMSYMFTNCRKLSTLDVTGFNTSNVQNMEGMLFGLGVSSLDVTGFDTSNVTNMRKMFSGCGSLTTLDVTHFNTKKVTDMREMFSNMVYLQAIDLSSFHTSSVTKMQRMFDYCRALETLNLSQFDMSKVTSVDSMFYNCNQLTTIYCNDNWNTATMQSGVKVFYGCTSLNGYNASNISVAYANPTSGYFSAFKPHVIWCDGNKTLYFQADGNDYAVGDTYDGQTITRVWKNTATWKGSGSDMWLYQDITATGYSEPEWYDLRNSVTSVIFEELFAYVRPTSTFDWFMNFKYLATLTGLNHLNTSETKTMYCMFINCEALTSVDISGFDMSNVYSTEGMFFECSSLKTVNCGSLDLAGVDDVSMMFEECTALTTIYCDQAWSFADDKSSQMFDSCTKLVGGSGVAYDANHVTAAYANPTTGYFTDINTVVPLFNDADNAAFISSNNGKTKNASS